MKVLTRLERLEAHQVGVISLARLHARLGIINGRPDRSDPVQCLIGAIDPQKPGDRVTLSNYLDALAAFGRGED